MWGWFDRFRTRPKQIKPDPSQAVTLPVIEWLLARNKELEDLLSQVKKHETELEVEVTRLREVERLAHFEKRQTQLAEAMRKDVEVFNKIVKGK